MEHDIDVVQMTQYACDAYVRVSTTVGVGAPFGAFSAYCAIAVLIPTVLPGTPPSRPRATWIRLQLSGLTI